MVSVVTNDDFQKFLDFPIIHHNNTPKCNVIALLRGVYNTPAWALDWTLGWTMDLQLFYAIWTVISAFLCYLSSHQSLASRLF